jgi:alpha-beta hydrolase superfamily lysophospholipase/SAM-dependent methyltransferase
MMQVLAAPPAGARKSFASEHTFLLSDGTALFYRAWIPAGGATKALVLFHRGHEHSGRWQDTVDGLGLDDVAVFAWDARGHGRSGGTRGEAPDVATVVRDVAAFMQHLAERHGVALEETVVLGHSVGAVLAAAWVHDYAPPIRGLILATPAFRVRLYVPFALALLRLRQRFLGPGTVTSYVRPGMLTHDAGEASDYRADPLIFSQIAVSLLLDLHGTSTRLLADAGAITTPTLLLSAGSDWVVKQRAQDAFFDGLGSSRKSREVLSGFHHAIFHESNRARVFAKVRSFLRDCFQREEGRPSLANAHERGYTKREYDRLSRPSGLHNALVRLLLKTVGRLSTGIRLGWRTGFDSGSTLDYVYANRAQGLTPLGRLIDRAYLDSIGWRGIRQRRIHLVGALRRTIQAVHSSSLRVHILDVASGAGRYVLETMHALRQLPITAVLRDNNEASLEAARRLCAELHLPGVRIEHGDAFDAASFRTPGPRPSIALVSGLYELFSDNDLVLGSLRGLAETLAPGGYLLYTNQPWHPQLAFIAGVLRNREGKPWVMRRRTQAEMDELVARAGFTKLSQEIDRWGLFTGSVARKGGA